MDDKGGWNLYICDLALYLFRRRETYQTFTWRDGGKVKTKDDEIGADQLRMLDLRRY
jgi:hypothetical protein